MSNEDPNNQKQAPKSFDYAVLSPVGSFIEKHGLAIFLVVFYVIYINPKSSDERKEWLVSVTELKQMVQEENRVLTKAQASSIMYLAANSIRNNLWNQGTRNTGIINFRTYTPVIYNQPPYSPFDPPHGNSAPLAADGSPAQPQQRQEQPLPVETVEFMSNTFTFDPNQPETAAVEKIKEILDQYLIEVNRAAESDRRYVQETPTKVRANIEMDLLHLSALNYAGTNLREICKSGLADFDKGWAADVADTDFQGQIIDYYEIERWIKRNKYSAEFRQKYSEFYKSNFIRKPPGSSTSLQERYYAKIVDYLINALNNASVETAQKKSNP
jgi:hypothetical protein